MKREIKFRAWDGERMLGGDRIGVASGSALVLDTGKTKDWPLMQYTGLKDGNGVEIYEGDILREGTTSGMLVKWKEGIGSFALAKNGWLHDHYFGEAVTAENCEVIGNIHQHPELLK